MRRQDPTRSEGHLVGETIPWFRAQVRRSEPRVGHRGVAGRGVARRAGLDDLLDQRVTLPEANLRAKARTVVAQTGRRWSAATRRSAPARTSLRPCGPGRGSRSRSSSGPTSRPPSRASTPSPGQGSDNASGLRRGVRHVDLGRADRRDSVHCVRLRLEEGRRAGPVPADRPTGQRERQGG